jgi:hypothetical protein
MTLDHSRQAASARIALLLGFAAVFALWLVWGTQLVQNLRHIEDNVESLQRHYVRGEQALSRVRTNVLLGSIYLRDALIDSAPVRQEYYRSELNRLRDEIESLLHVSDGRPVGGTGSMASSRGGTESSTSASERAFSRAVPDSDTRPRASDVSGQYPAAGAHGRIFALATAMASELPSTR